jgi:hypothetical protein
MIHELKLTDKGLELLNQTHRSVIIDISKAKKKYRESVISRAAKKFFNKPAAYEQDFLLRPKVFDSTKYLALGTNQKTICRFGDEYSLPYTGFVIDFQDLFKMEKKDLDLGDIDYLRENFTEIKDIL